jgi:hypothetical protein
MAENFFDSYLKYTEGGEVPTTFHRWSAIVGIAALLERNCCVEFGHTEIYPNIYSMLIGSAGTRKSSAIKLMKKLLIKSGYQTIAAERTSKEKFLHDLSKHEDENEDVLEANLFQHNDRESSAVTPMFIAADEANDFFGINNMDFLSILGSLWDWEGKYENRIKSGSSDWIPNPTISILSGNTATGFSLAFPSSILGQGFFSRLLIVYGEPNGRRVTIPRRPSDEETAHIVGLLQAIRMQSVGVYSFRGGDKGAAFLLFDKIYQEYVAIDDPKFESYSNRRIIHLLKLCLVVAAARMEKDITETSVIQANTYLAYIEKLMPKALGEFGKAKSADVAHKVMSYIYGAESIVQMKDIWKQVDGELDRPDDLQQIIRKLLFADKIQTVNGGFLPIRKQIAELDTDEANGMISFKTFLTSEELGVKT